MAGCRGTPSNSAHSTVVKAVAADSAVTMAAAVAAAAATAAAAAAIVAAGVYEVDHQRCESEGG